MGNRDSRRMSAVFWALSIGVTFCGIVPACHLVAGIDRFSTDPSLDEKPNTDIPCLTESDCPGKNDDCNMRACIAGKCELILAADGSLVMEQTAHDCKRNQCDGAGKRIDGVVDMDDVSDDGKECTIDTCSATGEPLNTPVMAGTECAMGAMDTMVCDGKGACVQCANDTDCTMGRVCSMNHCVPITCVNQSMGEGETDIDCGGPDCQPCATGFVCIMDADCQSASCKMGICAEPDCGDGTKNGLETDTDCGGNCMACAEGLGCSSGADCTSKVCAAKLCQAPTCDDKVQNGDEIHIDCGGSLCGGCAAGASCTANIDCASEFCSEGICAKIVQVATGTTHTCAIVEIEADKGKLYCWGGNNYGELGIGAIGAGQPQPTEPLNLDKVTSVSTFSNTVAGKAGGHSCARHVLPDGTAKFSCWGRNESGELGNGTKANSIQPVAIKFAAGVEAIQVIAGGRHTCAIAMNGHVLCWGANGQGQLGINDGSVNTLNTPQNVSGSGVPNPFGAEQLVLGTTHTCARLTNDNVYCWGANARGQVGVANTNPKTAPIKLNTITGVKQLSAGQDFTCGLTSTTLFCWGDNSDGQLRAGSAYFTAPTSIDAIAAITLPFTLGASGVDGIPDSNGGHSCFIIAGEKLVCLGLNDRGQLGKGDTATTSTPTEVNIGPVKHVSLGTQFTCTILEKGALRCWGRNDLSQLGNGESIDSSVPVPVKWPDPK